VGLALFAAAAAAAATGAIRGRRFGAGAAWVSAFALTAATYWLFHSSLDWFWPYPAITAPVFALLGSACAPTAEMGPTPERRGRWRLLVAGAAIVLAVSTLPPFLSERYVNDAYDVWRTDPARAYDDLDRARSLNPLSVDPLLAEGAIAKANGDRRRAIQAFRDAIAKRPEEWVSYYLLAVLHRNDDPSLARRELAAAHERDPHNGEVDALAHELRSRSQRGG
jgi:tetratricopeptide (TPR) repeat protein